MSENHTVRRAILFVRLFALKVYNLAAGLFTPSVL